MQSREQINTYITPQTIWIVDQYTVIVYSDGNRNRQNNIIIVETFLMTNVQGWASYLVFLMRLVKGHEMYEYSEKLFLLFLFTSIAYRSNRKTVEWKLIWLKFSNFLVKLLNSCKS